MLVGDTEFGANKVLQLLDHWGWNYTLRQSPNGCVQKAATYPWQRLDRLLSQAGQRLWLPNCLLTKQYAYTVTLLAYLETG